MNDFNFLEENSYLKNHSVRKYFDCKSLKKNRLFALAKG